MRYFFNQMPPSNSSCTIEGLRTRVVYPTIKCGEWPEMPNKWKKMVYPLLPKCSNFQITEFSPALETDFESIFISGGYNQGGCGLDHFASEPFISYCILWRFYMQLQLNIKRTCMHTSELPLHTIRQFLHYRVTTAQLTSQSWWWHCRQMEQSQCGSSQRHCPNCREEPAAAATRACI